MKTITKLFYFFLLSNLFYACSKDDCPKGIKYSYKYFKVVDNIEKKTFPYQFKDTQIWINVNTNDTLRYLLKDTVSSYDTTMVSPPYGCVENNYTYSEQLNYNFLCVKDTFFNFSYIYQSDLGLGFLELLRFNKILYQEQGGSVININNFGMIYKDIYVSKFFAENDSVGIVRITLNNTKLYRIK
jgi:hypothetical protein